MNRRGLLTGLIGAVAAPAVVRAESLMKIVAPEPLIVSGDSILYEYLDNLHPTSDGYDTAIHWLSSNSGRAIRWGAMQAVDIDIQKAVSGA